MSQSTDPLEGFRPRTEEDDANEKMVRGIRGLANRGIDYTTMSDVVASQNLMDALKEDTTLAKLVTYCAEVLKTNTYAWTRSNDPASMVGAHLECRAARMVIDWVESIEQSGMVAEQLISQQDTDNDE